MNINQLLRKLPDELVTDLATKFGLPLTTSTSNQAEMTIIPYLKRNPKEEGDKLLDNIESSLRPYELKRLLSIFRVGSQSYPDFQSIRDNLSPLPYLSNTDASDDFDIVSQMEEAEQEWQISQHEISEIEDNEELDSSVKTSNLQIQPKKLIDVFRSMNYSLGQAVSDLIDNSIDSGAKNVNVKYGLDEDLAVRFLIVSDDGKGMSAPNLRRH